MRGIRELMELKEKGATKKLTWLKEKRGWNDSRELMELMETRVLKEQ